MLRSTWNPSDLPLRITLECSGLLFKNHQSSRLCHLQDTARPRSSTREPVLPRFRVWLRPEWNLRKQDYWSDVPPRGSLLKISNSGWLEGTCYSPSSMTKSRNKEQTVGEKYSGIEFLQTPGRTPASGSLVGDAPGPHWEALRVWSQGPPLSSGKWKYSDKGILPYFWIWKSLTLLADQDRPIDDYIMGTQTLEQGIDTSRLRG